MAVSYIQLRTNLLVRCKTRIGGYGISANAFASEYGRDGPDSVPSTREPSNGNGELGFDRCRNQDVMQKHSDATALLRISRYLQGITESATRNKKEASSRGETAELHATIHQIIRAAAFALCQPSSSSRQERNQPLIQEKPDNGVKTQTRKSVEGGSSKHERLPLANSPLNPIT